MMFGSGQVIDFLSQIPHQKTKTHTRWFEQVLKIPVLVNWLSNIQSGY